MESLYISELHDFEKDNASQSYEKLPGGSIETVENPQNQGKLGFDESLAELLKPSVNPLFQHGKELFMYDNQGGYISAKHILANTVLSPNHLLYIISKRVEFTAAESPKLTDQNKDSQKLVVPLLEEFCKKFDLQMLHIPST